jgi:hypothetical protein
MNRSTPISGKGIFLASLLAPLVIGAPVLLLAALSAILVLPLLHRAEFDSEGVFVLALNAVVPLYCALVVGCLGTSAALRSLGLLRRKALLVVAVVVAAAVSALISCDWSASCEIGEFLPNFALFSMISAMVLVAVMCGWWWIAVRLGKPTAAECDPGASP